MAKTYVLKIYKPGTKVYRTALVPGWATLDQLHQKIHEWMEFPTYEMYGFFPNNKLLSESGLYAPQMQDRRRSAADFRVDDLHLRKDQRILYVYDMQQLMQFYIHVEDIEDHPVEEIRLLRRNGHLNQAREIMQELPDDPDSWRVESDQISMFECVVSNELLELVDTINSMNLTQKLERDQNPGLEEMADLIQNALHEDETLVLRMMPLHLMQALRQIWDTPDGMIITLPYDFLIRLSLLGFV